MVLALAKVTLHKMCKLLASRGKKKSTINSDLILASLKVHLQESDPNCKVNSATAAPTTLASSLSDKPEDGK